MMRVPFDRKPRPDGTKPRKEKDDCKVLEDGTTPKSTIKQASKQASSHRWSVPLDERQGDFMAFHPDDAGPACPADSQEEEDLPK